MSLLQTLCKELGWKTMRTDLPDNMPNKLNMDSRNMKQGDWFLPINGKTFDGHDFIPSALAQGAAGFFYASSRGQSLSPEQRKLGIEVPDTTLALQDLAHWWRHQCSGQLVAITGSSGKTTVKEMVAAMLNHFGRTLKTASSLNNELGLPITLCRLTHQHKFAVLEMGARHKGDLSFLSRIADQEIGVVLNVGSAHLGEFGSIQNILDAKMEICTAPSIVFLSDDTRIKLAVEKLGPKNTFSFGKNAPATVLLTGSALDTAGQVLLQFLIKGHPFTFRSGNTHHSFPLNVAACLAIGIALGLDPSECFRGLESFVDLKGRFQLHRIKERLLIDDSYNANPESMAIGLATLQEAYGQYAKTLILGDMLELGDSSEAAHRAIGLLCASAKPQLLVTIGPHAKWIGDAAKDAGLESSKYLHCPRLDDFWPQLKQIWSQTQLLYVKASNGLKLNLIVEKILTP